MESVSYCIKAKTLKQFKEEGLSSELLTKLKEFKDETYKTKEIYLQELNRILGEAEVSSNEEWLLKHAETSGRFNGETYAKFLQQILDASSSRIILIEDGAPYHRSRVVKDFVESHDRLTTVPLPTFSPDFNPIEKLWKNTKRDATHCKYFKTFDDLRKSVLKAFTKYLDDASKVICVMKKLRSEADAIEILNF